MCGFAQQILPGKGGKIWLTEERYKQGYQAADRLSITKVVEVVCEIPDETAFQLVLSKRRRVAKARKPDGTFIRRGGGWEVTTSDPITVQLTSWQSLEMP
jgi:hypothetical protein